MLDMIMSVWFATSSRDLIFPIHFDKFYFTSQLGAQRPGKVGLHPHNFAILLECHGRLVWRDPNPQKRRRLKP